MSYPPIPPSLLTPPIPPLEVGSLAIPGYEQDNNPDIFKFPRMLTSKSTSCIEMKRFIEVIKKNFKRGEQQYTNFIKTRFMLQ